MIIACHPCKHAIQASHTSTNSMPFLKLPNEVNRDPANNGKGLAHSSKSNFLIPLNKLQ